MRRYKQHSDFEEVDEERQRERAGFKYSVVKNPARVFEMKRHSPAQE